VLARRSYCSARPSHHSCLPCGHPWPHAGQRNGNSLQQGTQTVPYRSERSKPPSVNRPLLRTLDDRALVAGERNRHLVRLCLHLHDGGAVGGDEVTRREVHLARSAGLGGVEGESTTVDLLVEGLGVEILAHRLELLD